MTTWLIEPHDPLIFRDGRPFGPTPGARATSLPFPFPSTTTGGVRTLAGLDEQGIFDTEKISDVKRIKVRGPLLAELALQGDGRERPTWLVRAPADAVLFATQEQAKEGNAVRRRLVPVTLPKLARTDFDTHNPQHLDMVGLPGWSEHEAQKPLDTPPTYWGWDMFEEWLHAPDEQSSSLVSLKELGHHGPQRELRVHVSIDSSRRVGRDEALFDTSGMEFIAAGERAKQLAHARRLALAVMVDIDEETRGRVEMRAGLNALGSERRVVCWRRCEHDFPPCPDQVMQQIPKQQACRLILLTPACFKEGYYPTWLCEERDGVTPQVRAVAVQRPQVVSGWDMTRAKSNARKPSRRLTPAGSVLFLCLKSDSKAAIEAWIERTWMHCISDDEQDRADGFGLVALGIWDGHPKAMEASASNAEERGAPVV
ncbi:MAG: CRISPR-associated protein Cmr3 [Ktedonobacteraceae bacterium]|nr:CRISPR-associated protein Cmr3 [Ktedonobacteraceae bacterium]